MELLLKVTAATVITVILGVMLSTQRKDITLLLSIACCVMIATASVMYLEPIISFVQKLLSVAKLENTLFDVLLKAVGIGLVAEVVGAICADSGNAALGRTMQILATAAILRLSVPLFERLIQLLEGILGAI